MVFLFQHLKLLTQFIYFTAVLEHRHLSAKAAVNEYMDRNLDDMEACTDLKVDCYSLLLMINVNSSVSIDCQRRRVLNSDQNQLLAFDDVTLILCILHTLVRTSINSSYFSSHLNDCIQRKDVRLIN